MTSMKKTLVLALTGVMVLSGSAFGADVVAPFVNDNNSVDFLDIVTAGDFTFFTFIALANLTASPITLQAFFTDQGTGATLPTIPAGGTASLAGNQSIATRPGANDANGEGAGAAFPDADVSSLTDTSRFAGQAVYRYTGNPGDVVGEVRVWTTIGGSVTVGITPTISIPAIP